MDQTPEQLRARIEELELEVHFLQVDMATLQESTQAALDQVASRLRDMDSFFARVPILWMDTAGNTRFEPLLPQAAAVADRRATSSRAPGDAQSLAAISSAASSGRTGPR